MDIPERPSNFIWDSLSMSCDVRFGFGCANYTLDIAGRWTVKYLYQ